MTMPHSKKYVLEYPVKKITAGAEFADTITPGEITFQRHKASDSVMWVWGPAGSATQLVDIEKARLRWNALVDAGWTLCD